MNADSMAVCLRGEHLEIAREPAIALVVEEAENVGDRDAAAPRALRAVGDLGHLVTRLGDGRVPADTHGDLGAADPAVLRAVCEQLVAREPVGEDETEFDEDVKRTAAKARHLLAALPAEDIEERVPDRVVLEGADLQDAREMVLSAMLAAGLNLDETTGLEATDLETLVDGARVLRRLIDPHESFVASHLSDDGQPGVLDALDVARLVRLLACHRRTFESARDRREGLAREMCLDEIRRSAGLIYLLDPSLDVAR